MTHSEQINELATALAAFHAEAPHIDLDGAANAGSFRYKYASLPEILSKVRPILTKHGLAVLQLVGPGGAVETMLTHTSGQWIASDPVQLPSKDNSPQGYGSAISYAKRYSLAAILALAGEEDDDGATAQREHTQRKAATNGAGNGSNGSGKSGVINDKQAKRFYAMSKEHNWSTEEAKVLLRGFGVASSKEIPLASYDAICAALADTDRHDQIAATLATAN